MIRTINDVIFSDIADAIREKNGETTTYKPTEMPDAILAIEGGGGGEGLPEDIRLITGDCKYKFYQGAWDILLTNYGSQLTTKDITNANYMFGSENTLKRIPFELNFKEGTNIDVSYMYSGCYELTEVPKINNCRVYNGNSMFGDCRRIREYPEDMDTWFDWSYIEEQTSSGSNGPVKQVIHNNYSLRKYPVCLYKHGNPQIGYSNSIYYGMCNSNYALDEIRDIPFPHLKATWTSNAFWSTFNKCQRLKEITFALQEDGTPYSVNWKSQTIDLSGSVGYVSDNPANITGYNSGITKDKQVYDDATYAALKADPDWFTNKLDYCRYNHDSAVNTINSLPDTSAYLATQSSGTNTIKFKKAAGAKTDGGAISTLTEEEIAVAAAKGWTVSLV